MLMWYTKKIQCTQVATIGVEFKTGQASLLVKTAAVPNSGNVTVSLVSQSSASGRFDGVAGIDAFKITASDWVGMQGRQLQYEFRYMRVSKVLYTQNQASKLRAHAIPG